MLILKLSAIDSTNAFLKKWVQQTKAYSAVGVWAEHQTHGRGSRGSKWQSGKGLNLTGSVYIGDLSLNKQDVFDINKRVCLAIVQVLQPYKIPDLSIKWPNDILSGEKKLGGVLIEPFFKGNKITGVVVGCGINVNQRDFPTLPCATSIQISKDEDIEIEPLFELLANQIETSMRANNSYDEDYNDLLFGYKKTISFTRPNGDVFLAKIDGISKEGRLQLVHADGLKETVDEKALVFTAFLHCQ
ncbi:MAG: biotin--[acetyl-CoA-carboxylase] ligase [Flavobacteriaceae bacterium]|nr:biotin--[acetyl-CoA-carboxylase] ligase [Flavobacteriaceae bacterium]